MISRRRNPIDGDAGRPPRPCHAPHCVRYFLTEHPRREWRTPRCGDRAPVARHHRRHQAPA
ncbi:CGNR zinc finger domain-containing protein [Streptomyces iakyrus]|uniref:CGNR zinc finger domain-containing protein n=1 Tax=Streptomyces iakyrus TaxID=68219 RepID=UPI003803EE5B